MNFDDVKKMESETARVSATYELFNEETRLKHSKAARVEFLTTVETIKKYLRKDSKIIDIGAGAGEYSLYFAEQGHHVTAIELAEANVSAFQKKLRPEHDIHLVQGNACDLSSFSDNSFDIVLLFGPLYHLERAEDRSKCVKEAMRVCKADGTIFFAFISNDMVILTELCCYDADFFTGNTYNHATFKVENFPFVFFTVEEARDMLVNEGINIVSEIASDGVSELIADKINAMDEDSYAQYLKYHLYCCEKPEMLGRSNHLLFVGRK